MGILIFFLLTLVAAAIIAYPLLPSRAPAQPETSVSDADIDRGVRHLRRVRVKGGHSCPACGRAHQPGDQFCSRCGAALLGPQAAPTGPVCPSCAAAIRESDQFCAKCGHEMTTEEAA